LLIVADSSSAQAARRPDRTFEKNVPDGNLQYGLIAEEVAQIYPDLVIRNSAGGIEGIHHEELAPILLSELQQQRKKVLQMSAQLAALQQQLSDLTVALKGSTQTQLSQSE
jgi:hypothetical protein